MKVTIAWNNFLKISETAYTYSKLELIIGAWLNFRKI